MLEYKTIKLSRPIKLGENECTEVVITEPTVSQLKGLVVPALKIGVTDHVIQLLPRITEPQLSKKMLNNISSRDLSKFTMVVMSFFMDPTEWSEEEEELDQMEVSDKVQTEA